MKSQKENLSLFFQEGLRAKDKMHPITIWVTDSAGVLWKEAVDKTLIKHLKINGRDIAVSLVPRRPADTQNIVRAEIAVASETFSLSAWVVDDAEGNPEFRHGYCDPLSSIDDDNIAIRIRWLAALCGIDERQGNVEDALDELFAPVIDRLYRKLGHLE